MSRIECERVDRMRVEFMRNFCHLLGPEEVHMNVLRTFDNDPAWSTMS